MNIWNYGKTYYTWRAGRYNSNRAKALYRKSNPTTKDKSKWLMSRKQERELTRLMGLRELSSDIRACIRDCLYNRIKWLEAKDLINDIKQLLKEQASVSNEPLVGVKDVKLTNASSERTGVDRVPSSGCMVGVCTPEHSSEAKVSPVQHNITADSTERALTEIKAPSE